MSLKDTVPHSEERLYDLPTFKLSYTVDDEHEPTEITIYSEGEDEITTRWVTMDVDHVVDLDDIT